MFEFLTAGVIGTITGFVGNIVTGITNYKMQKLKNEHDEKMAEWDIKHLKAEADANIKITKAEVEGEIEIAEIDAFKKSYSMLANDLFDKSYMKYIMSKVWLSWLAIPISLLFATVDFMKHMARPALTYYLVGLTTWVMYLTYNLMNDITLTGAQAFSLFNIVIMTVIYMTASTVGWWFADRRTSRFTANLMDGNKSSETDK